MISDKQSSLLEVILKKAALAGADGADIIMIENNALNTSCRLGKPENIERSEGQDIGLRVFIGQKQAIVSTNDFRKEAIDSMVSQALSMAQVVPEDPYCGLIPHKELARNWPDLELTDNFVPSPTNLIDWAKRAEDSARAVSGVTNSEGADASWGRSKVSLATSEGFIGSYERSQFSLSASVIAGTGTSMERDYEWSSTCFEEDLISPEKIGAKAGHGAVNRLNPKKAISGVIPVIYDPRVSNSIVSHMANAISGTTIARGTSFLIDQLGQSIFAPSINIIDEPHRSRGLRSRPFDGEGFSTSTSNIIKNGVLNTWLLDHRAAKQLKLKTTGHASRGTNSIPSSSPSNLYMQGGNLTPIELMKDIDDGLYVTELIGMGVNSVTGDYSRGAAGFWIKNGKKTFPVNELTIAGNLKDMFLKLTPANDLSFRFGINAPTIRIDGMTVAGQK